ncbi:MAG: PAS domain-containing sensor histidine kinase [Candidatus Methanoperedens sp.]|nr:PAS domain-containing sensor histidine kinase [Candidatus Methanoperedens sp.]MCE8425002.1 PAS domain-containing sensor histidine kinase [Candidatus Methanoperedens sp.]MCE8427250.1 PAS domain-containing sensor histidine kinase [Candidatus Methanoperedens sp.]
MNVELITYRGRIASMGTVKDIADQKRAETALYASEKKYSTLVEKSNDGIVIVQDGLLKFANPMMSGITGFNLDDIKEKQFIDFISVIEYENTNILSNAIKYDTTGKHIVISGEDMGGFFRIRIMDFGKGIKDDEKMLLFERFRWVEKKGIKGSGLGLAIAKKIMDLHNGRIVIENNPDGGAIFIVDIPKSQTKSDS